MGTKSSASVRRALSNELGISTIALAAILILIGLGATLAGATKPNPDHKVTLCHATDSYTNPYVVITVDVASVLHHGHGDHDGPVFFATIPKHTKWGDIIPPFNFGPGEAYAGKNWNANGMAIFDDGCRIAANVPTTTTPPPPPTTIPAMTTTTVAPPASTTTAPSEVTTTSAAPASTTIAATTTTTKPSGATTSSTASVGPTVTTAAVSTTTTAAFVSTTSTSEVHGTGLAFTGARNTSLVIAGLACITAGAMLLRRRRLTS